MIAETAMLLMVEGPAPGKRIFMDQPVLLIGRDERCDIVIVDRQVSRQHASITLEEDSYVVRDLDSKNGTFVNGQELGAPYALQDGDEIQIAYCCKLAFVGADATAPVASSSAYLKRFISGRPTVAMVAAVAGLDPQTAPKPVQAATVAMASPPRVLPRYLLAVS